MTSFTPLPSPTPVGLTPRPNRRRVRYGDHAKLDGRTKYGGKVDIINGARNPSAAHPTGTFTPHG